MNIPGFGDHLVLDYPLNEYRAMWQRGNEPLVERLRDKSHTWSDLKKLIPHITVASLLGYTFTCPDMIGGGELFFLYFRCRIRPGIDCSFRPMSCFNAHDAIFSCTLAGIGPGTFGSSEKSSGNQTKFCSGNYPVWLR